MFNDYFDLPNKDGNKDTWVSIKHPSEINPKSVINYHYTHPNGCYIIESVYD